MSADFDPILHSNLVASQPAGRRRTPTDDRPWVFDDARRYYCTCCHAFTYWELRDPNTGSLEDERCSLCLRGRLEAHETGEP